MDFLKKKREIIFLVGILLVPVVVFFVSSFTHHYYAEEKEQNSQIVDAKFFKDLSLEAESAFVWDVRDKKVIYNYQGETQLPLASLTKLMTAVVSSQLIPEGSVITINDSDLRKNGDNGLVVGEKWNYKDILNFTLITSSNDGAHALAMTADSLEPTDNLGRNGNNTFVDFMNKKARELKLTQTFFLNESGLDLSNGVSGGYGSARDMATLMSYIIENKPELLEATKYSNLKVSSENLTHIAENTNIDVDKIPGIIASKTGFTDLAGGNLVVAFDLGINHPVVVAVLGSTKESRFSDVGKLISATIKTFGN